MRAASGALQIFSSGGGELEQGLHFHRDRETPNAVLVPSRIQRVGQPAPARDPPAGEAPRGPLRWPKLYRPLSTLACTNSSSSRVRETFIVPSAPPSLRSVADNKHCRSIASKSKPSMCLDAPVLIWPGLPPPSGQRYPSFRSGLASPRRSG